jgi:dephospho-CoA kinase
MLLGITGGIATGKSSFVAALQRHLPGTLFDADATAHELLASDPAIHAAIRERFGSEVFDPSGLPNRIRLRELIFRAPERRAELEGILHPIIRQRWLALAAGHRASSAAAAANAEPTKPRSWFYLDIPLLYETAAESELDRVAVVACSPATQRARLRAFRNLDDAIIEKIIGAQHDLGLKMTKADHVIWNDSTVSCLDGQAKLFAGWLRNYHV